MQELQTSKDQADALYAECLGRGGRAVGCSPEDCWGLGFQGLLKPKLAQALPIVLKLEARNVFQVLNPKPSRQNPKP